jgi:NAD(P)H:quinone oxidoreductase type IV
MAKIYVVFYSTYGHVHTLANAVVEGAREVAGAEVTLWQVPELMSDEVLVRTGAAKARTAFAHIPIIKPENLAEADAIIFGTPTRFGNMTAQMRNLLDQTGQLWASAPWDDHRRGAVHVRGPDDHERDHGRVALWRFDAGRRRWFAAAYSQ